jgi:RNA polymerase sigma-70 factor (ECF subfamily)
VLRELYDECVRVAAVSSRSAHDTRDTAHTLLLDLIARGSFDLHGLEGRAFLRGAVRKHAAFEARTEARRRVRETHWQGANETNSSAGPEPWRFTPELLAQLSPALRAVAALASAELGPREIRSVLRLSDTAFRKR